MAPSTPTDPAPSTLVAPRLPRFAPVARRRPVAVVQPGTDLAGTGAPFVAVATDLDDHQPGHATMRSGGWTASVTWDGGVVALEATDPHGVVQRHVSRRHGRPPRDAPPTRLALALTGHRLTAFTRGAGGGSLVARAMLDLAPDDPVARVHDEDWLAGLEADAGQAGRVGPLGLRDVRLVTPADGTAYVPDDEPVGTVLLSATSAGPGAFTSGHTSVWALDPATYALRHRADLFFRRPAALGSPTQGPVGVYGDHAVHVLRDGDRWLVAASTWGDHDRDRRPGVACTLAEVPATGPDAVDLTRGSHVLDARPLELGGLAGVDGGSVGAWDPHLVRTDDGWLVAAVSARRFFEFHPVLASGPSLAELQVRAAATERVACEGVTLARLDDAWWVLASEGRDAPRATRATYPVLDLALRETGRLEATYPTNIPWPTLVPGPDGPLLVGFDATPAGGPLPGYGTHGDVVLQAPAAV